MTDKELLELAAKAAGISGLYRGDTVHIQGFYVYPNNTLWNPLTDNGDALWLAVKLELNVCCDADGAAVIDKEGGPTWESAKTDPYAATRRAIVRAAAAIGEKM